MNKEDKLFSRILNKLEDGELKLYNKFLEKSKTKLNEINYKKISDDEALFPVKDIPLEWWYFTGHLIESKTKKRFGFEFCFFKFHPLALRFGPFPISVFRKTPFLIEHFAITDNHNKKYYYKQQSGFNKKNYIEYLDEKSEIKKDKFKLMLNRSKIQFNVNENRFFIEHFDKKHKSIGLKLDLKATKKFVRHYNDGYLQMYDKPAHKTFYYSFTRLKTSGEIRIKNKKYIVEGESWFDHQKLNIPHKSSVIGWDWFSIMLDDNREIMFFTLKDKKGLNHQHMGGSFINEKSEVVDLKQDDVKVESLETWTSKKTKITYPQIWNFKIEKFEIDLQIVPVMEEQEFNGRLTTQVIYWEGACEVFDNKTGAKIGKAYVEITGEDKRAFSRILRKITA